MVLVTASRSLLTRANLLLNSIHRKIQGDPGGNFGDEFSVKSKIHARKTISAKSDRPPTDWVFFAHALSVIICNYALWRTKGLFQDILLII